MPLTDEQKEQLREFDADVRMAAEEMVRIVRVPWGEPIDPLKLGIAIGVIQGHVQRRADFLGRVL